MKRRKTVLTVGAAVAVMVAAVTFPFPLPALSRQLSGYAEAEWNLTFRTEASRLSLLGGAKASGVSVLGSSDLLLLSVRTETVLLEHQWPPIPPLEIDRITLIQPTVTLTIGPRRDQATQESGTGLDANETRDDRGQVSTSRSGPGRSLVDFRDASLALVNASVVVQPMGDDVSAWHLSGFNARLDRMQRNGATDELLRGLSAAGPFQAEEIRVARVGLEQAEGLFEIAGGAVVVTDLRFSCGDARLLLPTLDIDFTSEPFSLTTTGGVLRRVVAAGDSDQSWTPLASLLELGELCRTP